MFRTYFAIGIMIALMSCGANLGTSGGAGEAERPVAASPANLPPAPAFQSTGNEHFAAPGGKRKGKGNKKKPWDLATALSQPSQVRPGDTIWLRGGDYTGSFVSQLNGTASAPIIVRQYPNERAVVDGDITLNGQHTILWGFEVKNSNPAPPEVMAINNKCPGSKLINMIIHDSSGNGIGAWEQAPDSEVYGCLLQYCGVQGSSPGRHAHGIYVQNVTGSKAIRENIIIDTYGYGIHEYGASASLNDILLEGNVVIRSGYGEIIIQGGRSMNNPVVSENLTYRSDGNLAARFDAGSNAASLTVTDNRLVGGVQCYNFPNVTFSNNVLLQRTQLVELIMPSDVSPSAYSWDGNVYKQITGTSASIAFVVNSGSGNVVYDFNMWKASFGKDQNAKYLGVGAPTGTEIFIRPNKYEQGRAHIIVYNWDHEKKVKVDLSKVLPAGAAYEVRNAQDYFAEPVASGTYDGGSVRLPMSDLSVARPAFKADDPPPTGPEFNAFVLIRR
jgi:hypothetical protein